MTAPTLLRRPTPWIVLFAIWFAVLYWLSSRVPKLPPGVDISDKILHFGYFGLGGALLGAAMCSSPRQPGKAIVFLVVAVAVTLCGVFDEWHQSFTPGRTGNDPGDLAADAAGGFVAGLLSPWFFGRVFRVGRGGRSPEA